MYTVSLHPDAVLHTLRGGVGASWHALHHDLPLHRERYDFPCRLIAPRGSAFGGNPPAGDSAAWAQITRHAAWLGLNFIRVEIDQRMYAPAAGVFDWENDEMQALYRILDHCEAAGADVFLQQMWMHTDWNSFPGVHPLISAPRSMAHYTAANMALLHHLVSQRNYTCIRYFCLTNEPPGGTWGYWWSAGSWPEVPVALAWADMSAALERSGLPVVLAGPDWTSLPPCEPEKMPFASHFGAIDIHSYDGIGREKLPRVQQWAQWAHAQNKPFFITEIGNMSLGWGGNHPGPASRAAALSNAADMLLGFQAGVDGFNRWSFTNRGDLDGQWQLIRTWDTATQTYLTDIVPEPEAYFGFGMVSRFLAKYSSVVACHSSAPDHLICTAVKSPAGDLTLWLLNLSPDPISVEVSVAGAPRNWYRYAHPTAAPWQVNPEPWTGPGITAAALSVTVLSTLFLAGDGNGVT